MERVPGYDAVNVRAVGGVDAGPERKPEEEVK